MSTNPYGEFAPTVADKAAQLGTAMEGLKSLVDEARQYEREIVEAEEQLKARKDRLRAVVEDALPKAMRMAGMNTGDSINIGEVEVTLRDKIENSIPADRRQEAMDWLEANGHSDIVKRTVSIAFAVGETQLAADTKTALEKEHGRTVLCERKAEPATVKSILTQLIVAQKSVPRDLFGVREFSIAAFKNKKK